MNGLWWDKWVSDGCSASRNCCAVAVLGRIRGLEVVGMKRLPTLYPKHPSERTIEAL